MDSELGELERVKRVRERLSEQYRQDPSISLIDIGSELPEGGGRRRLMIRVHLRTAANRAKLDLPPEIEGVPIRVIRGDYRLE